MSCPKQAGSRCGSKTNVAACRSNCTMCTVPKRLPKCPEGIYVERVKSLKPNLQYVSSSAKFEGLTTYKEYYVPKCGCPAQSLKPAAQFFPSEAKFAGLTTYRENFHPKPLVPYQKPIWSKKSEFDPSCAKIEGVSTYRHDYVGCQGERVKSMKPFAQFDPSSAPLDGNTTYRTTFVPYCPHERGYAKQPIMKKLAAGDMSCAPFEGMSTYRGDFWKKPIQRVQSLKPHVRGAFSDAPFADRTTYRQDFVPFHFSKCPENCIPASECPPELFCCQPDEAAPTNENWNPCPKPEVPPAAECPPVPPCPACPAPDATEESRSKCNE